MRRLAVARRERGERAVAALSGVVLGLVAADTIAPRVGHRVVDLVDPARLAAGMRDPGGVQVGSLVSYVLVVLLVLAGLTASLAPMRSRAGRRAWACAAVAATFTMSWRTGLALVVVAPLAWVLARQGGAGRRAAPSSAGVRAAAAAAGPVVALAWGARIVSRGMPWTVLAPLAVFAASLGWVAVRLRAGRPSALERDALAASPTLLLPLAALLRSPSPWLLVGAVVGSLLLGAILGGALRARAPAPPFASALALAFVAVAVVTTPMRLHDLAVNFDHHEGHHLAWIQSALEGKLLMADADTAYGLLREYLLTAWAVITSPTADHVRAGFVLANTASLPLALALGWRASRGRASVFAVFVVALVGLTPLHFLLGYDHGISLGWVDLARLVLALAAVVFGLPAVLGATGGVRTLVAWGLILGASLLYSPEFALCGIASVGIACVAHRRWTRRPTRIATRLGIFLLASAAPIAACALVYGLFGRATLLLATLFRWVGDAGAGLCQAGEFPLTFDHLEHPLRALVRPGDWWSWCPATYAAPLLVYAVAGAALVVERSRRRWSDRATLHLALVLFGLAAFRVPLNRADMWHLASVTLPAILLATELLAAIAPRDPGGRLAVVAMAFLTLWLANVDGDLTRRISDLASGREAPASGPPHAHPDIPRAGDVTLDDDTAEATRYILRTTRPGAPIFCRVDWLRGSEIYFLAARRNPTRFDSLAEILTRADQREILGDLARDPPVLVVGSDARFVGDDVDALLRRDYDEAARFGSLVVSRRKAR